MQQNASDEDDSEESEERRRPSTYWSQLFLMSAGALFLGFNVAPTEEMLLIAYIMEPGRVLAMVALSLAVMHAFVYAVEFHGQASRPMGATVASEFVRLTVVGYALTLLISAYVLWTFGRTDGLDAAVLARATVVLGFPASIGAAAARLIL